MKQGILFDLDGTLWDSSVEVADSWLLALRDCPDIRRQITAQDIRNVMGKTMTEIADILFEEVAPERRAEILSHCVSVENEYIRKNGGQLFEGIKEVLLRLSKEYELFIVSNCQNGYIEAFLSCYDLEKYFKDFECFENTGNPKGENIRLVVERNGLERAVYVGDTQGDYEASTFAGLPFIHAKMGYGTVEAKVTNIHALEQLPEAVGLIMNQVFGT